MSGKECAVCKERQHEINRILKSYKRDKKLFRITIICLIVTNFYTLAYGPSGLKAIIELIKGVFT